MEIAFYFICFEYDSITAYGLTSHNKWIFDSLKNVFVDH